MHVPPTNPLAPAHVDQNGVLRHWANRQDQPRRLPHEVAPGRPGRASDLSITLEEYFPDFALDEGQRPFSRSDEHRNPAALLTVERGGQSFRAFVIRSMPGIHRVFGLGRSFSLLEVEPGRSVAIGAHREPGAALALLGGLLLAAGLLVRVGRARGTPDGSAAEALAPGLVPGAALLALLLLPDRGAVVAWSFGVPSGAGRLLLPGAGVLFGAALIACLAGVLLLVAQPPRTRPP